MNLKRFLAASLSFERVAPATAVARLVKNGFLLLFISLCCISCKTPTSEKIVDFHLVKITGRNEAGWLIGIYEFRNEMVQPILIPSVDLARDGVAHAHTVDVGFEILVNGKWKDPGYYHDGISPGTYLGAREKLSLQIEIPIRLWARSTNLWDSTTPFRTYFGGYVSSPSKLEDFQY